MNHFHKFWTEAEQGINGFVHVSAEWYDNPTRDQKWCDDQRKILGEVKFTQEVLCQFNGSQKSLINGSKLGQIATFLPVLIQEDLKIYAEPEKGHAYVISVDTSRGQHIDYSAFVVFDISIMPYKVVATYKNNAISPMAYPFMILQVAQRYNNAHALVEINDLGEQISSTLFYEYEYENIYFTYKDEVNEGRGYPGVRTTKKVKAIGCSTLKEMVEQDQLLINSHDILQELSVFVQKGASYATEQDASNGGVNDDLTTCCWLFAWLTKQPLFSELTNVNIRAILAKKTEDHISENMVPFGIISDGSEDAEEESWLTTGIDRFEGAGVDPFTKKFGGKGDPFLKWLNS